MFIKNFLKRHFLILKVRNRFSAQAQIAQRHLYHYYRDRVHAGHQIPLQETGFRVFSQFEEDGMLLYIFSVLGMGSKTFLEIGADDGINSNCANLVFNFGWSGLFIDANAESIRRGTRFYQKYPHPWHYQPKFACAHVSPENINEIIAGNGISGAIELLSIDIDGDDYWIWKAIEVVDPKVVIIETHVRFGLHNIVVPYGRASSPDFKTHHGASPVAMVKLGRQKGYKLIGANQLGFNFIFVKDSEESKPLPEVDVKELLNHPSVVKSMITFEMKDSTAYITPIP